jgi:hypothetical protein
MKEERRPGPDRNDLWRELYGTAALVGGVLLFLALVGSLGALATP